MSSMQVENSVRTAASSGIHINVCVSECVCASILSDQTHDCFDTAA